MRVLNGVLSESWKYYKNLKSHLEKRLQSLPKGSVKKRLLSGRKYYYLQYRIGSKIIQKYVGKQKPLKLEKLIHDRKSLKLQLKEVKESLKLLSKVKPKNA